MSYKGPAKPIKLALQKVEPGQKPYRPTVGDVIRSRKFRIGIQPSQNDCVWVGVDEAWVKSVTSSTRGNLSIDETRTNALFLVTDINLDHGEGPDDMDPGHNRLTRVVEALRLTEDGELQSGAERIRFNLEEGMSVALVAVEQIELIGCVTLPISWQELE